MNPYPCFGINTYDSKYQGRIYRPCCQLANLYLKINGNFSCQQQFTDIETIHIYKISVVNYQNSMFYEQLFDFIITFLDKNIVVCYKLSQYQVVPLYNRDRDIVKCLNWYYMNL